MKFVVIRGFSNEVKLHYETKDKIKKIAAWVGVAVVTIGSVVYIRQEDSPQDEPVLE